MLKKRYTVIIYWAFIIALAALYFTNDFGLVDIHKTSVVVAVGVDTVGDEVAVTAQIAVPQPSQSGENIHYTMVQGTGLTIADALNEINSKTGFYPKLQFLKLILIGEECQSEDLFKILGCFYRRNFSELTALVAMCQGRAEDMLAMPATISPENTVAMQRALSEELKKSANVSTVNLKEIAKSNYSVTEFCYMPFIEANKEGTSESGGNGDNVGGESGGQGGSSGGGSSGQNQSAGSGQSQGGSSGGESGGGSSGQSQSGGQDDKMEFTARKTAVFSGGRFVSVLNEQQAFALNLLKNGVRLAVVPCDTDETHYTVGLKNAKGSVKLKLDKGVPEVVVSFKAIAQVQGAKKILIPGNVLSDDAVKPEIITAVKREVQRRFEELVKVSADNDCDILGVRELLHKHHHKYYETMNETILKRMKVDYKLDIKSLN